MFPTVYLCFLPSGDWDGKLPEAERQVLSSQEFQTSHLLPPLCWAQSRVGLQYRLLTGWKASTKQKISEKDEGTITGRLGTIPVALKVCANISWMRKLGFREDSTVGVVRPGWDMDPSLDLPALSWPERAPALPNQTFEDPALLKMTRARTHTHRAGDNTASFPTCLSLDFPIPRGRDVGYAGGIWDVSSSWSHPCPSLPLLRLISPSSPSPSPNTS